MTTGRLTVLGPMTIDGDRVIGAFVEIHPMKLCLLRDAFGGEVTISALSGAVKAPKRTRGAVTHGK